MSTNKLSMRGQATGWRKSHRDEPTFAAQVTASISGRALKLYIVREPHKSMELSLINVRDLYEFLKEHFESLPPEKEMRPSSLIYQLRAAPFKLLEEKTGRLVAKDALAITHSEDKNDYFIDENEEGIWLYSEDGRHTLAYKFV